MAAHQGYIIQNICWNTDTYVYLYVCKDIRISVLIDGLLILDIFWHLSEKKDVKFWFSESGVFQ